MIEPKAKKSPLTLILMLSAVFFGVFLLISGALFMYRVPGAVPGGGSGFFASGTIGVVEISGVILDSKKTLRRLERFEEDDDIKAVVLRLNSPGGAVAPSQEIYEAVRNYKKPLVVSMASVAASGAFYIACGAKHVFANPGTLTGSIGVIMEFANIEKLLDWAKIQRYSIKTGKFKDTGAEYRAMTADERALMQSLADEVLGQFKAAVAKGRNLTPAQVTAIADGRILSGSQAKAAKLVDGLGTIQDAIDQAAKLASIKGKPNVVYPEKPRRKWMDLLLDEAPRDESVGSSAGIFSRMVSALTGSSLGSSIASIEEQFTGLAPGIYWLWAR
jgi:protease IV